MKLSKEKRSHFVLAVVAVLMVVSGLWFTLIRYQQTTLDRLREERDGRRAKLKQIMETINNRTQIEAELIVVSNRLALKEQDMASGDWYSAMITAITRFKQPYDVDIPQFTPSQAPTESSLMPRFPYKQFTLSVQGTACYSDLGQFVADFENRFPSSRILNLELAPSSISGPNEKFKLSFKMDIVSLVKPSGAR
jgi:Tfp pilus assembly protein PilO